ncbi:hypothetical protein [Encephalitozoon cuniculi GB-M1]|uniref:Uncharacterized protein n=2 Tax=Encephalitozoon cuniculi TaxID=6035 RepID=Q8SW37_ENCCU|nr:uncharacterized protein ECU03_0860 [Encephalitozoon cuniculi GB-M1]AGE95993.1 hypothetical protein ECU03_0860 [Encephalitozoon cuniculi]KMV66448.1 hypothetical protein M970_030780 [Encephalitozoon cuniculi EcunIII-L]UYI28076.1 hypothetical protein J0A71_09g19720 [Encephalitozoon cuniculi]CAD26230.1 hypothetical protein [Encephalitozoon cuniculi GB-M1]
MILGDYVLAVLETTGNAFVVGCSTAFASGMLRRRDERPYSRQPLRSGGELAKHAMLYSTLYYGLGAARASGWVRLLGSSFIASFICGVRNGRGFGIRSGVGGMASSVAQEIVNKIRGD